MKQLNRELLEQGINKIAELDLDENNIFGSSYIVKQNGETVFEKCFGFTGNHESDRVNKNSIFRLASMTKPITAIAILILVDRGLISLNEPIKKHFPEFESIHIINEDGIRLGKPKTDVTVFHLLSHTSGFGSIKPNNMTVEEKETYNGTIGYFVRAGLDFEPFTRQAYSGVGAYDVLGALVEKVTGEDYGVFLKREIFTPCNMPDTTFMPSNEQYKRLVAMHDKKDGKSCESQTVPNCIFEGYPSTHKLAGAGLASTLIDYSNFAEMLLNCGSANGAQILSQETFSLLANPHVPFDLTAGLERWGLGVRVVISENYPRLPVGAYGWSGAYGSHFWVDPENKITAVFMKNSRFDGGAANASARRFEGVVHDALV